MPYVLTLGIIPSFCHEHYQYGNDVYKVTNMTGWIPFIYPLFSNWRYGFGNTQEIRTEIERLAQQVGVDNPSNVKNNSTSPCTSLFTGRASIL